MGLWLGLGLGLRLRRPHKQQYYHGESTAIASSMAPWRVYCHTQSYRAIVSPGAGAGGWASTGAGAGGWASAPTCMRSRYTGDTGEIHGRCREMQGESWPACAPAPCPGSPPAYAAPRPPCPPRCASLAASLASPPGPLVQPTQLPWPRLPGHQALPWNLPRSPGSCRSRSPQRGRPNG